NEGSFRRRRLYASDRWRSSSDATPGRTGWGAEAPHRGRSAVVDPLETGRAPDAKRTQSNPMKPNRTQQNPRFQVRIEGRSLVKKQNQPNPIHATNRK